MEKSLDGDADGGLAGELLLAFGAGGPTRQAGDTLDHMHKVASGESEPRGRFEFAGKAIYGEVSRLALTDRARSGGGDRDLGVIGVGELSMCGQASPVRPN